MARPPHLALAVAVVAALVVPFRSLFAFDGLVASYDLMLLTFVARVSSMLLAVVGFGAVGYAYGRRSRDGAQRTLAVAAAATLVGVLAGNLYVLFATDVFWGRTLERQLTVLGVTAVLDAALYALVVLGGYALGADETP